MAITMKLFDKLFRRNREPEETLVPEPEPIIVVAEPMPDLSIQEANAVHKILAFKRMPMFAHYPVNRMLDECKKTFAEIHFGEGFTPDLLEYVWSGQFEKDRQENK